MSSNHEDVGEFHRKFGLRHTNDGDYGPVALDRDLIGFRLNFLLEELMELMEAVGATFEVEYAPPLMPDDSADALEIQGVKIVMDEDSDIIDDAKAFDALLDLNYVSHGTAHLLGYPWQIGWNAVQNANMAKERAASADESKRGSSFDVIKPPGWTAPNIERVIGDHGWRKEQKTCPVCGNPFGHEDASCEPGICRHGG